MTLGLLTGTLGTTGSDPRPWIRLGEWVSSLDWQGSRTWAQVYLIWSIGSHMAPSHADRRHLRSGALALLIILLLTGFLLPHLGETVPNRVGTALSHLGDGLALGAVLAGIFLLPISLFTRVPRRL